MGSQAVGGTRVRRGGFFCALVVGIAACVFVSGSTAAPLTASKKPVTFTMKELSAALDYVGVKAPAAANPKLSTISIGWVSDQTTLTGVGHTGNNAGAQTAALLLNQKLGGIKGHPVKLVTCFIKQSDADGATCAQNMLNNSAVHLIVTGELLTGEASFINTIAGKKPLLGVFTNGPGLTATNAFYVNPGIRGQVAAVPYMAKTMGAKNVAILGPDLPGVATALGTFTKLFGSLGVTSKISLYPADATDLTAPIAASGLSSADAAFVVSSTTSACIALSRAFTQLAVKTPIVSLPVCLGPDVKKALGDYPKWIYDFTSLNPLATHGKFSDTTSFVAAMTKYSQANLMTSGYAPLTFGAVLTAAKWINTAGVANYNETTMAAAAKAFTGPMFMGDPNIQFGNPPYPNVGATRANFYTYNGGGKFTTNVRWLCAPIPGCVQH